MGAVAVLWLLKVVDVSAHFPASALKAWGLIHYCLGEGVVGLVGSDLDPNIPSQSRMALPSISPHS